MADSSDIENALMAKLGADTQLISYAVNGVFWDEAPAGSTAFVIVSFVDELDVPAQGGRVFEDALYQVEYRERQPASGTGHAKSAAARIDALLDGGSLTVSGYGLMAMFRESRIRMTEVDEIDESIRWNRRGGNYRIQAAVS